jgi:diguanylate cyclase (GGDEF)-like protein/PAS domain S-box-containing protein
MADASELDLPRMRGQLAEMAAERDRLLLILRSMGDAVVCTDSSRAITFLNAKAESLTGWRQEEAIGMPVTSILVLTREDDPQTILDPARDCMALGKSQISERGTVLSAKDGLQRYIGYSVALVHSPSEDQQGTVMVFNDVTEVRTEEKKVEHTASHDPLTGLPNRLSFLSSVTHWLGLAKQDQQLTHYLCFIDLDEFKQVNDSGGHAAGDAVLREVAQIILKICSPEHCTARLGGDEFAVLMPNCNSQQAEWTARRLIRAIRNHPFSWGNDTFRIGASIGATMINRQSPELSEVLHQADMACYAAKERGRNRLSFYNGRRRTVVASLSSAARVKGL